MGPTAARLFLGSGPSLRFPTSTAVRVVLSARTLRLETLPLPVSRPPDSPPASPPPGSEASSLSPHPGPSFLETPAFGLFLVGSRVPSAAFLTCKGAGKGLSGASLERFLVRRTLMALLASEEELIIHHGAVPPVESIRLSWFLPLSCSAPASPPHSTRPSPYGRPTAPPSPGDSRRPLHLSACPSVPSPDGLDSPSGELPSLPE